MDVLLLLFMIIVESTKIRQHMQKIQYTVQFLLHIVKSIIYFLMGKMSEFPFLLAGLYWCYPI